MDALAFDYVVIGSGIAGLSAARELSQVGEVCILTKRTVTEGATQYAQGGIAVAMRADDAPQLHFLDTLNAGDGLCDPEAVRVLVEEGPKWVQDLIDIGTHFDKTGQDYDFTKEAAHGRRRILHAGDATGREIETSLSTAVLKHPNVTVMTDMTVIKLVQDGTRIVGCIAYKSGKLVSVKAKAVILATGGCGQIFERNTNPPVATGDGMMMAYDVGAALQDLEFTQFHPTTLYLGDKQPISFFLITEAIRGEGAVLRNSLGERFMPNYHPDAELAPRDIVARAIFFECQKLGATHVFLDLSMTCVDIAKRFPMIYQRCLEANIDITKDLIPVSPAAHYMMGGVKADIWSRTTVPGLYAVGEVSATGLHGANRLASNSLLDGLVFGHRAGKDAVTHWQSFSGAADRMLFEEIENLTQYSPFTPKLVSQALIIKTKLQSLMWTYVGIVRDQAGLEFVLHTFRQWQPFLDLKVLDLRIMEVQMMLRLGMLMAASALQRQESRGSHYRTDYTSKLGSQGEHILVPFSFS